MRKIVNVNKPTFTLKQPGQDIKYRALGKKMETPLDVQPEVQDPEIQSRINGLLMRGSGAQIKPSEYQSLYRQALSQPNIQSEQSAPEQIDYDTSIDLIMKTAPNQTIRNLQAGSIAEPDIQALMDTQDLTREEVLGLVNKYMELNPR